jgi:excisionase family DNA binding protein
MQEKILTPTQVAQILQIHQFTVLKYIKQGKIKASKMGRVYRIRESDLEKFLDQSSSGPSPQEQGDKNIKKSKNKNKKTNKKEKLVMSSDQLEEGAPSKNESEETTEITVSSVEMIETTPEGATIIREDDEYYILR